MKEESEKKLAEKKFIDIAAAKEVLTDAGKCPNFYYAAERC
jgi:DnaJ-class molecular chaperone